MEWNILKKKVWGGGDKFYSVMNSAIDNEEVLAGQDIKWPLKQDVTMCGPPSRDFP